MRARYVITNYPGMACFLRVELEDGHRCPPTEMTSVFDAVQYAKENLRNRGASVELARTWEGGTPTWRSEWVPLPEQTASSSG